MELTAEAAAARREYARQWRARNPDKVKDYERRKWERKAEQMRLQRAEVAVCGESAGGSG